MNYIMQLYIFFKKKKKKEKKRERHETIPKTNQTKLSIEHIWSQPKNIFFVI